VIYAIPTIFTPDALPGTALPIYPDLGQAPNMLACIAGAWLHTLWLGGLVHSALIQNVGY